MDARKTKIHKIGNLGTIILNKDDKSNVLERILRESPLLDDIKDINSKSKLLVAGVTQGDSYHYMVTVLDGDNKNLCLYVKNDKNNGFKNDYNIESEVASALSANTILRNTYEQIVRGSLIIDSDITSDYLAKRVEEFNSYMEMSEKLGVFSDIEFETNDVVQFINLEKMQKDGYKQPSLSFDNVKDIFKDLEHSLEKSKQIETTSTPSLKKQQQKQFTPAP